jgi:NAD(P)-dependent dehydrogenase (short-subunit alcohol dehydrogenase family)
MRATTRVCVHLRVARKRDASGRTSRVGVACSAGDKRVVVITGANTGLGKVTAQQLSAQGFTVVGACRNVEKGEEAAREFPMEVLPLDLSSLTSVRAFAAAFLERYQHCDVLVNNAGVMAPPSRQTTADGFELQVRCVVGALYRCASRH